MVAIFLVALGFVAGRHFTDSRDGRKKDRPPPQYLDEAWKMARERHESPPPPRDRAKEPERARAAIVIDDLGPNLMYAERLIALDRSLTLAVIPWQIHSREIVEAAITQGVEVILHQPMEARNQEGSGMEGMLTLRMTDGEIRETFQHNLAEYPGVAGINNHMGSAFTENEHAMGVVFGILRDKGLYFLDSRTSPHSVGRGLGRVYGVPVFERDVFLDNESDWDYMKGMWERFVTEAENRGHATIIAHGRLESIQFLEKQVPALKAKGLTLGRLSRLYQGGPDT